MFDLVKDQAAHTVLDLFFFGCVIVFRSQFQFGAQPHLYNLSSKTSLHITGLSGPQCGARSKDFFLTKDYIRMAPPLIAKISRKKHSNVRIDSTFTP